jgi:phosphoribosyl 1,2-cyclic phosphodiesterase
MAACANEALQVRFWGTRGSTPVSGPEFLEFGGNTPCVEIRCGKRLFVVDAGTGLPFLGGGPECELPAEIDILLSHFHLDHIGGLPFFKPAVLDAGRTIHTWTGHLDGGDAEEALDRVFSPPTFPLSLDDLPARFVHHGFQAGQPITFRDGAVVRTHPLNHPGGATGYRFDHEGRAVCYVSDLEHTDPWPDPGLAAFVQGADLVIYDGMFSSQEYQPCQGWGHSTWEKGVELCQAANAKALAVFHLYPGHTDDVLRVREAEIQRVMPSAFIARDRQTIAYQPVCIPNPCTLADTSRRLKVAAE